MKFIPIIGAISFLLLSCKTPGPNVPTYISKPAQGCMVRSQANECIPYSETENWISHKPEDFEVLLNWCLNPKGKVSVRKMIHEEMVRVLRDQSLVASAKIP